MRIKPHVKIIAISVAVNRSFDVSQVDELVAFYKDRPVFVLHPQGFLSRGLNCIHDTSIIDGCY